jgi:hypothetical protein
MADIMKLMRTLTWLSVRNNFIIHCKHISGVKNVIANAFITNSADVKLNCGTFEIKMFMAVCGIVN